MIDKYLAVAFALSISAVGASAGFSRLEALGMIESGNDDAAVGRAGEVSRFQIKPAIWRRYSPTASYRNFQVSRTVAEQHLADLEETFRRRTGREPDDFDLYVLWNAGPTYYGRMGFSKKRVHPIIRSRAQRYVNLRQKQDPPEYESLPPGSERPAALASTAVLSPSR